jgi:hypothetical protein
MRKVLATASAGQQTRSASGIGREAVVRFRDLRSIAGDNPRAAAVRPRACVAVSYVPDA